MNEQAYKCNDISLNYMEYGNGQEPMLLLHGATNRWQSFMSIIPDLSINYHLYALDFRGHGSSERAYSYTLHDYLDDVHNFIKEHIKKPVIIVGHSLGGMIGILLAAYYPNLVKQLVIIDTPLNLEALQRLSSGPIEQANWLIEGLRYSQLIPGLLLPEGLMQCDPNILLAMVNQFPETFAPYKERELFSKIICPLLLIRGSVELGSLVSEIDLKTTLELSPKMAHTQIAYAGHSPIRHDPEAVVEAIQSFLYNPSS